MEQNGTGKNSGSWKDGNEIRIQPYNFGFFNTILRSDAIVKNFNMERDYTLDMINERKKLLDITIDYYRAIQWGTNI